MHIVPYEMQLVGKSEEGKELEYLYAIALDYGAQLSIIRSNNIQSTLIEIIKKEAINEIVLGQSVEYSGNRLLENLKKSVNGANINVVPAI